MATSPWSSPSSLSKEQRLALEQEAGELNKRMVLLYSEGKMTEALSLASKALEIRERLYPAKDYPDGHADLAVSLNNLGFVLEAMGEPARALPHHEKALAMRQRLYPESRYKDGHPDLAVSL